MFLKTLQIKGFKSFADTAALDLEPGVTVVVGPNGSGKSNVVDAIGWVLGAQAPSAVRSQKMDDVIFAGSQKRPALGRAEVSLTIDNSAGMLPIDFSEVTISRTLFRSGDSEYALNGVPCRLLDITELLSDSGVGRQQHVIISQGQIDAVLNAKPEERRLIIEEAAGVLKFRRRKEKAERRLTATDANQTRVMDLLKEVRRQLRPLERQADAARRHGAVVAELDSLRLHLAGREIARLTNQVREGQRSVGDLRGEERMIKATLAGLDASIVAVEAELSAGGDQRHDDDLIRLDGLRERARGLLAVATERRRSIERERDAFVDHAVVATLTADQATARRELEEVDQRREALRPDEAALAESEHALRADREALAEPAAAPVDRVAAVRGELAALEAEQERLASAVGRAGEHLEALRARERTAAAATDGHRAELAAAGVALATAETSADTARAALAVAEADAEAVETTATAKAAEHHACQARASALREALDEARARAGAAQLAGADGVLGVLLDVIEIDDGWGAVVEQALAGVLDAVVVASPEAGRNAIASLAAGDLPGAVLALGVSGTRPPAPLRGTPIRSHVRGTRPGVDALLDVIVGTVAIVDGWADGLDASIAEPAATFVTAAGERFGPTGWRRGGAGTLVTAATVAEATEAAALAESEWRSSLEAVTSARSRLDAARQDARVAAEEVVARRGEAANAERVLLAHDDVISTIAADLASASEGERQAIEARDAGALHREELLASLPALEAEAAAARRAAQEAVAARRALDERASVLAEQSRALAQRVATVDQQRRSLQQRVSDLDERLKRHQEERAAAESRQLELDARLGVVDALRELLEDRGARLDAALELVRESRRRQNEANRGVLARLETLRGERGEAEHGLEGVRERIQRQELADAEAKLRLESVIAALRQDLDAEPDAAVAAECPPIEGGATPQARVRELERDLRLMGPINPLALEEFEALNERHQFLEGQLEDIRQTRRELAKVIHAVDEEIVSVFASAYADVAANFESLFQTLFPGGEGALRLTDPGNLLETGIELEARPSGKNVKKLSLLSGGERSLTALAYLFAVFRSRPSPFYVMDEVEAALDDVNLHRFLGLIDEFRSSAQLVIVSHQKRTMEAADVLYGVTMEPGGSSKVLSERVATVLD